MVVLSPSTLGLGAAAVTAWALQRRRLGTDKRMVVVDAGSGSTRCVCLGTRRCDGAVRVVGGPERVPRRLGDALLADDVDAWARDVARAVDAISAPSTPVRGAATAGAREALRKRGEKDLGKAGRAVEAALAASTRGRPTAFAVLSGAEEARLEFRAVNAALPGLGVLAGGGKSLQVASSLEDAASLDLDSFAGHERVKKHVPRRRLTFPPSFRPIGATVARQIPVLKVTRSNRVSVTGIIRLLCRRYTHRQLRAPPSPGGDPQASGVRRRAVRVCRGVST